MHSIDFRPCWTQCRWNRGCDEQTYRLNMRCPNSPRSCDFHNSQLSELFYGAFVYWKLFFVNWTISTLVNNTIHWTQCTSNLTASFHSCQKLTKVYSERIFSLCFTCAAHYWISWWRRGSPVLLGRGWRRSLATDVSIAMASLVQRVSPLWQLGGRVTICSISRLTIRRRRWRCVWGRGGGWRGARWKRGMSMMPVPSRRWWRWRPLACRWWWKGFLTTVCPRTLLGWGGSAVTTAIEWRGWRRSGVGGFWGAAGSRRFGDVWHGGTLISWLFWRWGAASITTTRAVWFRMTRATRDCRARARRPQRWPSYRAVCVDTLIKQFEIIIRDARYWWKSDIAIFFPAIYAAIWKNTFWPFYFIIGKN